MEKMNFGLDPQEVLGRLKEAVKGEPRGSFETVDTITSKLREAVSGSPKGVLHGNAAVAAVRDKEGILNDLQKAVIRAEGYSSGSYKDTKGIETFGVGQTGEFANESFKGTYDKHLKRTKRLIPSFESQPMDVQEALVKSVYRGGISGSPKALRLINAGKYGEAADEFLRSAEYLDPETPSHIKGRMEEVYRALKGLTTNE